MPTKAEWLNQGLQAHQAGNLTSAEQAYLQVLQIEPQNAEALHLLGMLCHARGQSAQAIQFVRQAIQIEPTRSLFFCNLGLIYQSAGYAELAVESLHRALQLNPQYAEAYNNLGGIFGQAGRYSEAERYFRQGLALLPNSPLILLNLAHAVSKQNRLEEAADLYRDCLRDQPDSAEAWHGLATALDGLARPLAEIEEALRGALRLWPNRPEVYRDLGDLLDRQGRPDEALACQEEAIRLRPDFALAHFSRALSWLRHGNYERGWLEYEWRWRREGMPPPRTFHEPYWDGSDLAGRTILLHAEQGLGDTLQFVRYAAKVKESGGMVHLECQPSLVRLLARTAGVDRVFAHGESLPPYDVQSPLLTLPRLFATTPTTIPADVPYLIVDPVLQGIWQRSLGEPQGLRVGISWQGNPLFPGDRERSVPLQFFEPFARQPGVQLYSLQKEAGREQLESLPPDWKLIDLGDRLHDLAETAAVMKQLDLVVTIDSTLGHLAGGLGIPVWILLPFYADWRWFTKRDDSPWYPSARLFRQARIRDWNEVQGRLIAALQERLG